MQYIICGNSVYLRGVKWHNSCSNFAGLIKNARNLAVKQPNTYVPLNSDNHRILSSTLNFVSVFHFTVNWTCMARLFQFYVVCYHWCGWYVFVCVCVWLYVCERRREREKEREKECGVHIPNMNVIYLSIVKLHCLIFSAVFCYCLL